MRWRASRELKPEAGRLLAGLLHGLQEYLRPPVRGAALLSVCVGWMPRLTCMSSLPVRRRHGVFLFCVGEVWCREPSLAV